MKNSATHRPVRFMLDGECIEASAPPSTMLLDWLRAQRRVGTKEGCAEGDCGACTVVLGRRDAGGALQVEPCNACIRPLASVDGCGVLTVEGLHGAHPVQQAMIECHASQCGFCTPGFVMALVARLAQCERTGPLASRAQVEQALAGNLCRCTGYRPIVDAALRAGERLAQRGEPALPDWLLELPPLAGEPPLGFEAGGARFDAPRSAEDVDRLLAASPQAWLLAGGTDVGLWVTKALREPAHWIALGAIDALRRIDADDTAFDIGANASLADAFDALDRDYPELADYWLRFASPAIRASGTLAGNLANGSPIGDCAPVLIALDSQVVLRRAGGRRTIPLAALYVDYKRQDREPGEWIERVLIPRRRPRQRLAAWKLSKRREQDISILALAVSLDVERDRDGERMRNVRIAFGGMAPFVRRAPAVEAALEGHAPARERFAAAAEAVGVEFTPLSDHRASRDYRLAAAAGLMLRAHDRLFDSAGNVASLESVVESVVR